MMCNRKYFYIFCDFYIQKLPINRQQFTTYDRDNDIWHGNCALNGHGDESGGWWHTHCNHINLNYNYKHKGGWGFIKLADIWYDPIFTDMKIHPVNCDAITLTS